jgi:hypothetical protein
METAYPTQRIQDPRLDTNIVDFGANTIARDRDGVSLNIQSSEGLGGRNFGAQFPDDNKYSGSEITSGLNSELKVDGDGTTAEGGRRSPTSVQAASIDNCQFSKLPAIHIDPHVALDSDRDQSTDKPAQSPAKVELNSAFKVDEHGAAPENGREPLANLQALSIDNHLSNGETSIDFDPRVIRDAGNRQNIEEGHQNSTNVGLNSESTVGEHGTTTANERQSSTNDQAPAIGNSLFNGWPSINSGFRGPSHQNMDESLQRPTTSGLNSKSLADEHGMATEGGSQPLMNFQTSSIDKFPLYGRPSINFDFRVTPDPGYQGMAELLQKAAKVGGNSESMADEHDTATEDGRPSRPNSQAFSVEDYLSKRRPSINFDPHVTLDSGLRQSMDVPLQKPAKAEPRGRALPHVIADKRSRSFRTHSESDLTHYDPTTGEPLPKYAEAMSENLQPHVGDLRHPLLQSTVDELARGSQPDLTSPGISQSELSSSSSNDGTPQDKQAFFLSPAAQSPSRYPASYEETTPWQRSRRSIDRARTPELAKRMEGMRSALRQPSRRSTSSSAKSPRSQASSWLRGFSLSSGPASPVDAAFPVSEGQTIGDDYVLGRQIGFGGFSTIHEVTQMMPAGGQRKLAAKVVRKSVKDKSPEENEQFQAEFAHEVELWRLLHHRHILPLETVWHTDEATYCFIPLNKGGTLFDLVRSNRSGLPIDLAKRYSYQLAVALRYLHCDARVAHRDVKLENCLLDTTSDPGEVRLCDFGMAEWISNDRYSSRSGPPSPIFNSAERQRHKNIGPAETSSLAFAGGSLDYAAPETLRTAMSNSPETAVISPAVDIWAYGVCVYTMLVGSRPFYHSFRPRISAAILSGDWDREKLLEKAGQDAFDLVQNCLEIDPEKRWDADDVLGCAWLKEIVDANDDPDHTFASTWKL